ncbi:sodium/proline symporter PutP [bacterium]|nr:sodium/proline symporter PutP [bacterium]
MIQLLVPFLIYIVSMIGIGFYFYKRNEQLSDYLLGGRSLGKWVVSMSAQASDMSGWLLLGLPGYAYLAGLEAGWIALGLAAGTYLNWKFVAARLRCYTEAANNAITLPDYFNNRFHASSNLLRIISALFILIFFVIYTSSGFVAGAKLFSTVFHLNYHTALFTGMLIIITYTFLGGFLAVCWTDFIQGLIMFSAILCVPLLALFHAGGFENAIVKIHATGSHLLHIFVRPDGQPLGTMKIISLLAWGLGYFGQPHILARFMAIRSSRQIGYARRIAMIWVILSLCGAVCVGILAHACLDNPLQPGQSETVFLVLVNRLVIPVIAGFLLSAVLAAIMSTADSQLLVASSAVTEDLVRPFFRKKASQKELVRISRASVIGIAALSCLIASDPESSVLNLVSYAWAGFGAAFGPVILLSLFWNRMTEKGALSGIITGGLTVLIWKHLSGGLFDLYEIVPGFILSALLIVLISLADTRPSSGILRQFGSVRHKLNSDSRTRIL